MSRVVYDEARAGHFAETPAADGRGVIRIAIDEPSAVDRYGGAIALIDDARGARRETRPAPAQYHVTIQPFAYRMVDEELGARADGLECGAWLVGSSAGEYVRVVDSMGSGSNPERFSDALRVDFQVAEELEEASALDGLRVIGHWHTHPAGEGRPSDIDRRAWEAWAERLRADVFVGLIISGAEDFDAPPRWDAFAVTAGRCEPATLSVQKGW
jgi:proteasome lid subunit RPN8/RPN11